MLLSHGRIPQAGVRSIDRGEDDITVRLEPKEGESFDPSQIAVCLEYVTAQGSPPSEDPGPERAGR